MIEKEKTRYFLISKVNCGPHFGPMGDYNCHPVFSGMVGITTDEKYARSLQDVFTTYTEIKMITQPKDMFKNR